MQDKQTFNIEQIQEIIRTSLIGQKIGLFSMPDYDKNVLSMKGKIRTKEKCPVCKNKFSFSDQAGFVCTKCLTTPKKYYIDLHNEGDGRIRLFTDKSGHAFTSYPHIQRTLEHIRYEIDQKIFDGNNYKPKKIKEYRFEFRAQEWLTLKQDYVEKNNLAPSYIKELRRYNKSYYADFFKTKDVRDLKTGAIEKFYRSLPKHLSLKTQKNIMDALFNMFKLFYEHDYIEKIPKFPDIALPEPDYAWIDYDIQDKIFENIPQHHNHIFYFMRRTGVRPGEARALQKRDINFKEKIVVIKRTFSDNNLREFTKTKRIRILPLADDVIESLKSLPVPLCSDSFVFLNDGKPYSTSTLFYWWKKAKQMAGISSTENLRLYDGTRHSFASQAINRGVPLNIVSAALGHTDQKMTKRYAHLLTDSLKVAFEKPSPNDRHQTVTTAKVVSINTNKNKAINE